MSAPPPKPNFLIVTHKCRSKRRFSIIDDQSLLSLMQGVGRRLEATPRMASSLKDAARAAEFTGVFALPTNNVLEVYMGPGGRMTGYLFTSLDVWATFAQEAPPNV